MPRRRTYRFRVPSRIVLDPAVQVAGLPALGLWCRAGSWAARHSPDGIVPAMMVRRWRGTRYARLLELAGLWEPVTDERGPGWRFVGWRAYPDGGGVIL